MLTLADVHNMFVRCCAPSPPSRQVRRQLVADNRKPASRDLLTPEPLRFAPDAVTSEVLALTRAWFPDHFGDLEPFWFAVTRIDAEAALAHFLRHALPGFGDFQDAMLRNAKFLHHAVISLYLNCGLLDPLAVCRAVEAEYRAGRAPLNAAEGFIRQVIGWREYVRSVSRSAWCSIRCFARTIPVMRRKPVADAGFDHPHDVELVVHALGAVVVLCPYVLHARRRRLDERHSRREVDPVRRARDTAVANRHPQPSPR